jgi:hypothetical protein
MGSFYYIFNINASYKDSLAIGSGVTAEADSKPVSNSYRVRWTCQASLR